MTGAGFFCCLFVTYFDDPQGAHLINFLNRYNNGIVLFSLVFLSHLFFSIHIAFVKCKYCSLVFFKLLLILDL